MQDDRRWPRGAFHDRILNEPATLTLFDSPSIATYACHDPLDRDRWVMVAFHSAGPAERPFIGTRSSHASFLSAVFVRPSRVCPASAPAGNPRGPHADVGGPALLAGPALRRLAEHSPQR